MPEAGTDDRSNIERWFHRLARHVQAVDFAGARPLFAADMVAFGTFTDFIAGRDGAERQQWRNVWHHIDGFRWRPDIRVIVSPDRLQAVGMGVFDSTAITGTVTLMIGLGGRQSCSLDLTSTPGGWRPIRTCRCSGTCPHGRSKGSRNIGHERDL